MPVKKPSFIDRPTQSKLAGRLYVLAAALMWSSSGLFAKAPVFAVWSDGERGPLMAFWRAVFASLILLPLVRRPRWRPALVPLALVFTLMNVTYLSAMALTTAANSIWLQSTAPWWVFSDGRSHLPRAPGAKGSGALFRLKPSQATTDRDLRLERLMVRRGRTLRY